MISVRIYEEMKNHIHLIFMVNLKAIYDRLAQAGQMDGYMQHYFGGSRISDQIFAILL